MTAAKSALGLWTGEVLLEYCPYRKPGCDSQGCWAAGLCRAARSKLESDLWEQLAPESRRGTVVWAIILGAAVAMIILAFAWPQLSSR
jgi:hypothetical protein